MQVSWTFFQFSLNYINIIKPTIQELSVANPPNTNSTTDTDAHLMNDIGHTIVNLVFFVLQTILGRSTLTQCNKKFQQYFLENPAKASGSAKY